MPEAINAKLDSEPDLSSVPITELHLMIEVHKDAECTILKDYHENLRTHQYWRNFYQRELDRRQK